MILKLQGNNENMELQTFICYADGELKCSRATSGVLYDTVGSKYPYVVKNSQRDYDYGSFTGYWMDTTIQPDNNLLPDTKNNYQFREQIKHFLTNGKPKIMEYFDGRKWLVGISSAEISEDERAVPNHTTISFDWAEIGHISSADDTTSDLMRYGLGGVITQ